MIALLALLNTASATAQTPLTLVAGAGGLTGPESPGAHIGGRMLFHVGQLSADLGLREGIHSEGTVGAIFAGPRWSPSPSVAVRGGFAHHHEIPMAVVAATPIAAMTGIAPGIVHRTGLELGIATGGAAPATTPDWVPLAERIGWELDLSASWMADDGPGAVSGWLTLSGTLAVGPAR
jgi:hypothetical protein